jgi:hypothetical protein
MSDTPTEQPDPDRPYYDKAARALRYLFDQARAAHELHFVMALMPEFRGMQDEGGIPQAKLSAPMNLSSL